METICERCGLSVPKWKKHKAQCQPDIQEFGLELTALIHAFPTAECRDQYREERRAFVHTACEKLNKRVCTYREYLELDENE